jgi:hypothetical protein
MFYIVVAFIVGIVVGVGGLTIIIMNLSLD